MNPEQEKLYNEILSKNIFNELQLVQIRRGLISNIDVSLYAKPEFTRLQMEEIRLGLILNMRNLNLIIYKWNN